MSISQIFQLSLDKLLVTIMLCFSTDTLSQNAEILVFPNIQYRIVCDSIRTTELNIFIQNCGNFWTGYRASNVEITLPSELGDFTGIEGWEVSPSEKSLKAFSDKKFEGARSLYRVKYKIAGIGDTPDGYSFDSQRMLMKNIKNGDFVNAIQDPNIWGGSTIWMSPARFSNSRLLFKTLGHELIHAWHSSISSFVFSRTNDYTNLTEAVAHDWSMTMGMKFGFDIKDFKSSILQFNKYYGGLNANGLSLYENTYHWYNNSIFSKYKWTQY